MKYLMKIVIGSQLAFFACGVYGQQLQRDWIRTFATAAGKTNQPTAIALAPDGNIVVAGTSQSATGDADYQIIKYKPDGSEVWRASFASEENGQDILRALAIDPVGNVIAAGTSATVKFNNGGAKVWHAPLSGRAVIANESYVYVAGFSEVDFSLAQLENNDFDGQEVWRRERDGTAHGVDVAQLLTADGVGNIYVAGQEEYTSCDRGICNRQFGLVSYTAEGTERWFGHGNPNFVNFPALIAQASSIALRPDGKITVYGTYGTQSGIVSIFNSNGTNFAGYDHLSHGILVGTKMLVGPSGTLFLTGRRPKADLEDDAFIGVLEDGRPYKTIWRYGGPNGGRTIAIDMVWDSRTNFFVLGNSPNNGVSWAMFLAKVDPSGKELGVDRFNSFENSRNFAIAMAIDANDQVYVTGYVTKADGGSEWMTIKYVPEPKIERKPSGAMHLEFHTSPGQQYAIEATTDFFNWQSLITNTADANGLVQHDDTTAPTIPYRFYRGKTLE